MLYVSTRANQNQQESMLASNATNVSTRLISPKLSSRQAQHDPSAKTKRTTLSSLNQPRTCGVLVFVGVVLAGVANSWDHGAIGAAYVQGGHVERKRGGSTMGNTPSSTATRRQKSVETPPCMCAPNFFYSYYSACSRSLRIPSGVALWRPPRRVL